MEMDLRLTMNNQYDYETKLERINLDEERKRDLANGNAFIINTIHGKIKKDIKEENGIFSTKFGQSLDDVNLFMDKYKCQCGNLKSKANNNVECDICKTRVKFVDDKFDFFGYIVLSDDQYIIHPNMFNMLAKFFSKSHFLNMLKYETNSDINGIQTEVEKPKQEPYYGIGILEFKDRFGEILEYYRPKNKSKLPVYDDIIEQRDLIFTQSIPVFTTLLRPYKIEDGDFTYEGTNKTFNVLSSLHAKLTTANMSYKSTSLIHKPTINGLLCKIQEKFNDLYDEIEKILSGKKGIVRSIFGGRCTFSSRNVIVPNPHLRVDEIVMPYASMVELLQQTIINVLTRSYNISQQEAYDIWYHSQLKIDDRVVRIILEIIRTRPKGLPVLINRNPTIAYGSILQMYIVDINFGYTLELPLQILPLMAADFDGDVLNILYIINHNFYLAANNVYNPRNCFFISSNDGLVESSMIHSKDTIINANSMVYLSRYNYNTQQLNKIQEIRQRRGW